MSRLRVYPGDDGDAERDREAQWLSLTTTGIRVFQPGDGPLGPNRRRTGLIYVHLCCNCRTRRTHGFDRCNQHITPVDHQRGYRYFIQCRQHNVVTERTAWGASLQLARNLQLEANARHSDGTGGHMYGSPHGPMQPRRHPVRPPGLPLRLCGVSGSGTSTRSSCGRCRTTP